MNNSNTYEGVQISTLINVAKSQSIFIVTITILMGFLGFVSTNLLSSTYYENSAQLMVINEEDGVLQKISLPLNNNIVFQNTLDSLAAKNLSIKSSSFTVNFNETTNTYDFKYSDNSSDNMQLILDNYVLESENFIKEIYPDAIITILQPATTPKKFPPNTKMNVVVLAALGFVSSLSYILFKFTLVNNHYLLDSDQNLDKEIITFIPNLKNNKTNNLLLRKDINELILPSIEKSDPKELKSYNLLKAHLIKELDGDKGEPFMFVSLDDIEGRTDVVENLAKDLVLSDKKVLVLNETNVKLDALDINESKCFDQLLFTSNTQDKLSIQKTLFKDYFNDIKDIYDVVLVNASSANTSSSLYDFSSLVNRYYFVVRQNVTKRKDVFQVIKNLSNLNSELVGVVLVDE